MLNSALETEHFKDRPIMNAYDFEAAAINGELVGLGRYHGKVLLIVNTASECGFTPQYKGLEEVYQQFKDRGFEVLGFPCNQFGKQEPGTEQEIHAFCERNYGVTFPLFSKVDVNGDNAHPLFKHLKEAAPGVFGTEGIKWNFTKFLINRDGSVYKRYAPQTKPEELIGDIEKLTAT
jgi:glutathione peroxidase